MKAWTGSAWTAEKPVKYWNGSAWVTKPVKYWNGSAWVQKPSAGGPWTPAAIPADITTWLQADTLSGVEGEWIVTWPDSGPDGRNFNRSYGDPNSPLLRKNYLNGKSVVYVGNAPMETSGSVTFDNFAIYVLWKGLENIQSVRLIDHDYLNWWVGRGSDTGEGAWEFGGGINQGNFPYGDYLRGIDNVAWHLSVFSRVGTTKRIRDNGGTKEGTFAVASVTTNANKMFIGVDAYYSLFTMDLYIAELLILDANVETNMTKIEGYLAWKWGLQGSLPAGHPYKSAAP